MTTTPKFDFDRVVPRRDTDSLKWDASGYDDIVPLWVADMDFQAPEEVCNAVKKAADAGLWGYTIPRQNYYDAVTDWFGKRHNWNVNPALIRGTTSVMSAISAAIRALTSPDDGIIIQSPVYNCFYSVIPDNHRRIIENPLIRRCVDKTSFTYEINYDQLEEQASCPATTALLLCNPHNPAGRVWTRTELEKINSICVRHGVRIISDEIHCELTMPGIEYTPFATINPEATVGCSPSKGFNMAGLQVANIICGNKQEADAVDRELHAAYCAQISPMGISALIAAYTHGAPWLDALRAYLYGNYRFLLQFIDGRLPVAKLEGTYLAWLDITSLNMTGTQIHERLLDDAHVWVCPGAMYGDDRFIRINLACPRSILEDGLHRISHIL